MIYEFYGRLRMQEVGSNTKTVTNKIFEDHTASKCLKQSLKITVHFLVLIGITLGGASNVTAAGCGSVNYGALPNNGWYYCVGTTTQRYNYCGNAAGTLTGLKNHPLMCTSTWSNSNLNTVQVCKNEKVTQCATLSGTTRCRDVYSRNTGWQWTPAKNTICSGVSFTQTSNCGYTRTRTGTKNCDLDGDGVDNTIDQCPNTPNGESVNGNGCSLSQLDADGDGVNDLLDQCPNTPNGETADVNGCSPSQVDTDLDGVFDDVDQCPSTPSGESANGIGCSPSQLDTDNDSVSDDLDQCPNTPSGEAVDVDGCGLSQLDTDIDGVSDDLDLCPGTPNGESVDVDGCSASQLIVDSDGDGISDALDQCPGTLIGDTPDVDGCSQAQLDQIDSDGDGTPDYLDAYPHQDSTQCSA